MQRTHRIRVRLNEKEKTLLDRKVKQSGLSREAYMRQLIEQTKTPDRPQPDYKTFTVQLQQIGNELNTVARKFHETNMIDVKQFDAACQEFHKTVNKSSKLLSNILDMRLSQ